MTTSIVSAHAWGAGLVVVATLLMLVAQLDMGGSWRVGIDRGSRPGLVVSGAFRVCRNPIFACMLAVLLGCVLLMPTYLSLLLFVASWVGVRLQVEQEERFLLESYGAAYLCYARTTGRFVPGIGLLRD
jgi:protein-S-isoprenylcysteine O-methyltransferase Ste14